MHKPNYIDDGEFGILLPICFQCKHLRDGMTCAAFPDGIPDEIRVRENDHEEPCCGQKNKIVFTAGKPDFTTKA